MSVENNEIRQIVIVEDHPVYRMGLKTLLNEEPDLAVCADVGDGPEALTILRTTQCDGVIVDVCLPGIDGLELTKHIRAEHPEMCILVVSMHDESIYALRALRAGARGYVTKDKNPEVIVGALRKALDGEIAVSPDLGNDLIYKVVHGDGMSENPIDSLTDRELEILRLVGQGYATQQIAEALHLSVKTVESHRLHTKEKLGLKSAGELVRFAMNWYDEQVGLARSRP